MTESQLELQHALNHLAALLGGVAKFTGKVGQALNNDDRAVALRIAWRYLGTPYYWGGDDPMAGFDCSGLMVEILQSVGVIPRRSDHTAQGLWVVFESRGCQVKEPYDGCLVFWSRWPDPKAIHVEMCLNSRLSIGASGGGNKTITLQDAIDQNAFIKIQPFRSRKGIKGFMDPFKVKEKAPDEKSD